MSDISNQTVTTTVTVAAGDYPDYPSPLFIDDDGAVAPSDSGATGVITNLAGNYVENSGTVTGGLGAGANSNAGSGGTGVLMGAGTWLNYGGVAGGAGGSAFTTYGGSGGTGVSLSGGTLTNEAAGKIAGGSGGNANTSFGADGGTGVSLIGGALYNFGGITGGGGGSAAAFAGDGGAGVFVEGTLHNAGSITGGSGGSALFAFAGTGGTGAVVDSGKSYNIGTITGGTGVYGGTGEYLGGGTLYNQYGGVVYGGQGTSIGGTGETVKGGTLFNDDGTKVTGGQGPTGGAGLSLSYGYVQSVDTIITGGSGTVGGAGATVSGGYLTNANGSDVFGGTGTDSGGTGLVLTGGGASSTFTSNIRGGSGTEGGIGAYVSGGKLYNFGVVLGGDGTDDGGVGVYLNGGTLITYSGIGGGSGSGGHADSVQFGSAASTMKVYAGAAFDNDAIGGFKVGDKIDMTYLAPTTVGADFGVSLTPVGGGVYEFQGSASGDTLTTTDEGILALTGNFSSYDFILTPDGHSGTDITLQAACYRRGTRIRTADGDVPIEQLRIGDSIATLSGGIRPIRWIGRRRYSQEVAAGNRDLLPIRIQAGALGDGLPRRDLWVSPEHAMWIDGMLIPARELQNGETIVQEHETGDLEYLHLEFGTHEVIFAEGAPAESFIDDESRDQFDNAAEYWQRHPKTVCTAPSFCAPRVEDGFELDAVRRRLERLAIAATTAPGDAAFPPSRHSAESNSGSMTGLA